MQAMMLSWDFALLELADDPALIHHIDPIAHPKTSGSSEEIMMTDFPEATSSLMMQ